MQRQEPLTPTHTAEPAPGSFRAVTGEDADLFNLDHYPLRATCRVCNEPIRAESFLRTFKHEDWERRGASRQSATLPRARPVSRGRLPDRHGPEPAPRVRDPRAAGAGPLP